MKQLLALVALSSGILTAAPQASAATFNGFFSWKGENGHVVEAQFLFEDYYSIIGGHGGLGVSEPVIDALDYLKMWVYDPLGNLLYEYVSVENGTTTFEWFAFSFDLRTQDFMENGTVEIGNDPGYWLSRAADSDEMWLYSGPGIGIELLESGTGYTYSFSVEKVSDSGLTATLAALAFGCLAIASRLRTLFMAKSSGCISP